MQIYTACWFDRLPSSIVRIGISRGTPRGHAAGYRMLRSLAPGTWFRSVAEAEYLHRYYAILAELDPREVVDRLASLSGGRDVAMLCFETRAQIAAGTHWCHRHVVAQWLNDTIGSAVTEFGCSSFDPWGKLRAAGVAAPRFGA